MKNRIGIVGGGQLGRMLAIDAKRMGFHVSIIDPTPESPAGQVADRQIIADYADEKAIRALGSQVDFLTFEIELANARVLEDLAKKGVKINPSAKTLGIIKDKLSQKTFLKKAEIPVADFLPVDDEKDLKNAIKKFGYPVVLKARFDGYDGRGNAVIQNVKQILASLKKLEGKKLYVEKFVEFKKELAVIVARSIKGEIKTYPVVETIHKNNICHIVLSPAQITEEAKKSAELLAKKVMKQLGGAGVFGIEMFLAKNGQVLINEIAPRVHNSGHHTIEAALTSQFEQHIRAITGLPLGYTSPIVPASVMINILGESTNPADVKGIEKALKIPKVNVHIYGKKETKIERKMGHITVIGDSIEECLKKAKQARKLITI